MDRLETRFYEQQNYAPTDSLLNQEISLTVDTKTTSIPTTLNSLGQPSDYMEVDFRNSMFQKLYTEANQEYTNRLGKLGGTTPEYALALRLQIRDQTLQKYFPTDRATLSKYEKTHTELNAGDEEVSLSDYFKAGSAVCIQRASLTAYYLAQHTTLPSELKIQKLPTAEGKQEYHAYIKIGNVYYDPTNPLKIQQPDETTILQPNITQKAEELLIPGVRGIEAGTQSALGNALKNAGENMTMRAA